MAYKVQKPCKVCGKLYTPCSDCESDNSAFHWRTVACSMDCGRKYFEMVEKARNTSKSVEVKKPEIVEEVKEVIETPFYKNKKNSYKIESEVVNDIPDEIDE